MSDNQQDKSPRARLQELLRIPERNRTDEVWDEIHELEISLAPGNTGQGMHRMPVAGNVAPAQPQRDRKGRPQRNRPNNQGKPKKRR